MFEMMRIDLKGIAERTLCELLKEELTHYLGRDSYERKPIEKLNYRNGYSKKKYAVKHIGELNLQVPRDRQGEFRSQLINKYDRYEPCLKKYLSLLFLSGLSTRGIGLISQSIFGRKISSGEVSKVNKELLSGIESWRMRDLSKDDIKYIGVFFHMRVKGSIENIPMLIVVGVTRENRKIFLTIQQGDKDKASTCREVFKDLKARGLAKEKIHIGIMDGLPGLMKVFREEFPLAKVQRRQVHVSRNILCKVPKKQKKEVSDKIRDIFFMHPARHEQKKHIRHL